MHSGKEALEGLGDDGGNAFRTSRLRKTMRGSIDLDEFGVSRYQLDCSLQFVNGTEDILRAADEQRWCSQFQKMSGSQLRWLSRWMERVGQQHETLDQPRVRGRQETGLAVVS